MCSENTPGHYGGNGAACTADRKGATYLVNNCRKTVTQTKSNGGQQVVFGLCGKYIIGVLWPEPYKLIYSPSLLIRFSCQTKIIEDTNASSSPLIDAFRSIFDDPNSVYSVLYTNKQNTLNGANGQTRGLNSFTNAAGVTTYKYEIALKDSYLDTATDLSIARTVIHENLHVILNYLRANNVITTPYANPTHN